MSILAEATAAQEFGRDAQGNVRWPTPGADEAAALAKATPSSAAATTTTTPAKQTTLTAEPAPEPPVVGQSSPVDRTEVKKKTLLGG